VKFIEPPLFIVIIPLPAIVPCVNEKIPLIDTIPLNVLVVPLDIKDELAPIVTDPKVGDPEFIIIFPIFVVVKDCEKIKFVVIVKSEVPPIVVAPLKVFITEVDKIPFFQN
jgi:hypothetical protein